MTKLKRFCEKVRQSVQNCLNRNLFMRSLLENRFQGTFSSKTKVVCAWKLRFSGFYKFFNDQSETISWESEAKHSKLFEWKFAHRKLLRRCLRRYLDLKNECCESLERAFYSFLQVSAWPSWNDFQGKWSKFSKAI